MASQGKILLSNVSATGAGAWVTWQGGRTSLIVMGTFPTTATLQMLGPDGTTAITISTPTVNGITALDLPAGSYRFNLASGSPSGFYATLVTVPYQ
jgi:hypothetical protein